MLCLINYTRNCSEIKIRKYLYEIIYEVRSQTTCCDVLLMFDYVVVQKQIYSPWKLVIRVSCIAV